VGVIRGVRLPVGQCEIFRKVIDGVGDGVVRLTWLEHGQRDTSMEGEDVPLDHYGS